MSWRNQKPGERFQTRQKDHKDVHPIKRLLNIGGGIGLILIGILLLIFPGPGWVAIFLGLGLLSGESRKLAVFLDWTDLHIASPIVRIWQGHFVLVTFLIMILGSILLVLGWMYGPAVDLGPITWGEDIPKIKGI